MIRIYDAGKADAILVSTDNHTVLIDTGLDRDADQLERRLRDDGVDTIDVMIITHFDKDHVGGADKLIRNMNVGMVYTSYLTRTSADIHEFQQALSDKNVRQEIVRGDELFTLDRVYFEISGTETVYEKDTSNNSSLIIRVSYGEGEYLFMGDAQTERIAEFMTSHDPSADFLKMPYHGHYQKILDELFSEVDPEEAVITNSPAEPERRELKKTEKAAMKAGVFLYYTAEGTVTLYCSEDGYRIVQS